jgi:lipopolysaccharide/colanic/teichoic acid biosynthesis glycosyltransferase
MVAIAIRIKLDSPGPAIFRHRRIGLFGMPFTLYKFRTMYADAKDRFPELYAYTYSQEELYSLPIKVLVGRKQDPKNGDGGVVNLDAQWLEDPRVTRTGRWLRRTSLDELPNFINVLKGDMHLVGPRPDIAENIRYYSPDHLRKLHVKPGITGLAQIRGRGKLSFTQTNEFDVEYVDMRSLALDLKILWNTIAVWVKGDGAF